MLFSSFNYKVDHTFSSSSEESHSIISQSTEFLISTTLLPTVLADFCEVGKMLNEMKMLRELALPLYPRRASEEEKSRTNESLQ